MLLDVNNRTDFEICSALRGPDWSTDKAFRPDFYSMKCLTTKVIRYFAGTSSETAPSTSPELAKDVWERYNDYQDDIKDLWQAYPHFRNHIYMALDALIRRRIDTDEDTNDIEDYCAWLRITLG